MNWSIITSALRSIPTKVYLGVGAVVVLGTVFTGLLADNHHLRGELHKSGLRADSVESVNDSTRKLNDFLYARRIVQTEQSRDSLDKALKQSTKTNINLTARIATISGKRSLDTIAIDAPRGDTLVNTMFFIDSQPPFTLSSKVSVAVVSDTVRHASLEWTLAVAPIPLGVRVACSDAILDGVRRASVEVSAPKFLTINVDSAKQSSDVCSPRAAALHTGVDWRPYAYVGIGSVLVVELARYFLFSKGK